MISSVLNLKQLEALVWVVDLGNFRKAAQHLNTTQPNISSRISGLENRLGIVLMHRHGGAVELTDKGHEIVSIARQVLRKSEEIVDIAERPDLISDRLRLGVTELVACTWLHSYLRAIKASYPALNVELTVDLSQNLDCELEANRLDVAIQTAPFASAVNGNIALGEFAYVWVAKPDLAQDLQGAQTIKDLLPHSILTHARHTQAYSELANVVRELALPTTRIVSSSSLASCVQMAADGMGVTLLPRSLVQEQLSKGELCQVDVDWLPAPLVFCARFRAETSARYVQDIAGMALAEINKFS